MMFYRGFKHVEALIFFSPLMGIMLLGGSGCGGDAAEEEISTIEGPFVQISGAQSRTLALTSDSWSIVCNPKLGLKEFEYEAANQSGGESGTYLRFTIGEYAGPGDYILEYDPAHPIHQMEVGLTATGPGANGKSFKYRLFQELRLDNNELYSSYCNLRLNSEELQTKTIFSGLINCIMLWADFDSSDSNNGNLTSYVDLVARFECEY